MINKELWNDAAQSFESSLMILRKDKNGWVIGFSVHPDEVPEPLLSAPLGTRFQAVLFRIGDDEQPVVPDEVRSGKKAVAMAGELCRKSEFQDFMLGDARVSDREEGTVRILRNRLGIATRQSLVNNTSAREKFKDILEEFRSHGLEDTDEVDYEF